MTEQLPNSAYGTVRHRRASVSYAEFERAANTLLATGEKPGLENIRRAIGGSPETIRQMLRRYWSGLATLVRTPADSLMRLPTEVADLADELWQRSLALAAQSASHDDNAARERLEQVKRENEVRSHALAIKERTLRERESQRDQTMKDLQEQVATLLSIVSRNAETIAALQEGKTTVEVQAEDYQQRLARIIARAVAKNQKATAPKPPKKRVSKDRRKLKPSKAKSKSQRITQAKKRTRR